MFRTQLELPLEHAILQLHVSLNACAHIPSTLWVPISYVTPIAMSAQNP
jgi:hypothetical protein